MIWNQTVEETQRIKAEAAQLVQQVSQEAGICCLVLISSLASGERHDLESES